MADPATNAPGRPGWTTARWASGSPRSTSSWHSWRPPLAPIGELALAAVSGLAEIYGQALARALDLVDPALVDRMLGDELIGHLLVLHGIHPSPIEYRTSRVIEGLRTALSATARGDRAGRIDDGVAILRLSLKGCGTAHSESSRRYATRCWPRYRSCPP